MIESLGIFFNNEIFGSEDYNYNFESSKYNLPEKDKMNWFRGFKWKGIYIRVMPIEKSKILLNEIKALNYFYFDYLQLLEEYEYNQDNHLLYKFTFVYDNHPYTDSKCLNKDVPAIAYTYDMELFIKAYEMNEEDKKYKEE